MGDIKQSSRIRVRIYGETHTGSAYEEETCTYNEAYCTNINVMTNKNKFLRRNREVKMSAISVITVTNRFHSF